MYANEPSPKLPNFKRDVHVGREGVGEGGGDVPLTFDR